VNLIALDPLTIIADTCIFIIRHQPRKGSKMTIINQQTFEAKFAAMTDAGIEWSIRDIRETMDIWRDEKPMNDPYMVKIWAEWDAATAEAQKRRAV